MTDSELSGILVPSSPLPHLALPGDNLENEYWQYSCLVVYKRLRSQGLKKTCTEDRTLRFKSCVHVQWYLINKVNSPHAYFGTLKTKCTYLESRQCQFLSRFLKKDIGIFLISLLFSDDKALEWGFENHLSRGDESLSHFPFHSCGFSLKSGLLIRLRYSLFPTWQNGWWLEHSLVLHIIPSSMFFFFVLQLGFKLLQMELYISLLDS